MEAELKIRAIFKSIEAKKGIPEPYAGINMLMVFYNLAKACYLTNNYPHDKRPKFGEAFTIHLCKACIHITDQAIRLGHDITITDLNPHILQHIPGDILELPNSGINHHVLGCGSSLFTEREELNVEAYHKLFGILLRLGLPTKYLFELFDKALVELGYEKVSVD